MTYKNQNYWDNATTCEKIVGFLAIISGYALLVELIKHNPNQKI